ncbi:shikimate dehydrogenase family protein [Martelella sp. AMO21009]
MAQEGREVTGRTRLYVVIGDPVTQVRAPERLNPLFVQSGIDAIMVPLHVDQVQLDDLLPALMRSENLDGILVTIPHKFAVCRHVSRVGSAAEKAGCANALRRTSQGWEAENFDGAGFVEGLAASHFHSAGKRILIAGCGGAGASIAASLLGVKPQSIDLFDVQLDRSRRLAERLSNTATSVRALDGLSGPLAYDLIINATPLGLDPDDPLPIPVEQIERGLVADVIMKPRETALLKRARERGLGVHLGVHMLDAQIKMYSAFFGLTNEAQHMGARQ